MAKAHGGNITFGIGMVWCYLISMARYLHARNTFGCLHALTGRHAVEASLPLLYLPTRLYWPATRAPLISSLFYLLLYLVGMDHVLNGILRGEIS